MRGIRRAFQDLSIRFRLLAIAGAAVLPALAVAVVLADRDARLLPVAIGAALAGVALSMLLHGTITRPAARLAAAFAAADAARLQAERASRAKSDFLASVSHELRTPLNAVIGFSELMKSQTLGPLGNSTYLQYAADINFSGLHLLEIINDILDVVRYEAGRLELREELVDVAAVIGEALRLVAPQAAEARVELIWRAPMQPLPPLYCERVRLRQMLLNILSNGIKFTAPGGAVAVTAALEDGLQLTVTDTGIGIRPEDIAAILTPFGQIASGYTRDRQGTGLGLTLTKALLERHGGRLEIDSTPGVGTTVRLLFPAERITPAPAGPDPGSGNGPI